MKLYRTLAAAFLTASLLTSCGSIPDYSSTSFPDDESVISPEDSVYLNMSYEGEEPTVQKTEQTFRSADGLCVIEKKQSYYDVTLDFTTGNHYDTAVAYAETITKAFPDYKKILEQYLYESIAMVFPDDTDYSFLAGRTAILSESLPQQYRDEINGFASAVSDTESGFENDGIVSIDEAVLSQFVPDVLRETSCSAVSVWGESSETGMPLTARVLEWNSGSESQLSLINCVVRMKNTSDTLTSITYLGIMNVMTGVNSNGLMMGILDFGSDNDYDYTDRRSYSWDVRYALENFSAARDAGTFMTQNASRYTFSHNLIISDTKEACCAEISISEERKPVIRYSTTPVCKSVECDIPDYICTANSVLTKDNNPSISRYDILKLNRYSRLAAEAGKLNATKLKNILTCENAEEYPQNSYIYSHDVIMMMVTDYSDHRMQVMFTGRDGPVNHPEFIDIGTFD